MNPVTRDLSAAADELDTLYSLGADVEQYGVGDPEAIRRARTATSFALAAAAESMGDAGMMMSKTIARLGVVILAGMRSPLQLEGDAAWCRELALACVDAVVAIARAA